MEKKRITSSDEKEVKGENVLGSCTGESVRASSVANSKSETDTFHMFGTELKMKPLIYSGMN